MIATAVSAAMAAAVKTLAQIMPIRPPAHLTGEPQTQSLPKHPIILLAPVAQTTNWRI